MLKEAYIVRNASVIRVPVTKVEVFNTYFRYVCDDMDIMLNWWKLEDMQGEDPHVFYTEEDALNSKQYKQQRLAKAIKQKEEAEKIIIELNNDKDAI